MNPGYTIGWHVTGVILSLVVLAVGFQLNAFNSPPVTFKQSMDNSSCSSYRSVTSIRAL